MLTIVWQESRPAPPDVTLETEERRLQPRFPVPTSLRAEVAGSLYQVLDLSLEGLALLAAPGESFPGQTGDRLAGALPDQGVHFQLEVTNRHRLPDGSTRVGCRLVLGDAASRQQLERFLVRCILSTTPRARYA